jgi:lipid II:glycine glycyltransferase (peptidoglycan interpeptide bridge formation enzyme)
MQSSAWAKVKKDEGWFPFKIALKEGDKIVAGSLILAISKNENETLLYSPEGPILNWHLPESKKYLDLLTELLKKQVKTNHDYIWRIEPWAIHFYEKSLKSFEKSRIDMQPRHTALIPLLNDPDEVIKNFKQKTRYNIRLAQRKGLKVEIGSEKKDFDNFYKVYKQTVDRKNIDFKEFAYFDSIRKHFSKSKNAHIISVKKDDIYIESILVISFGDRLTYFFGGFDYNYRKYMAPYLCHFEAMKLGVKLGCSFYDLWGIANTENLDHPWQEFTKFKLGFSPMKISLVGSRDLSFKN